MLLENRVAIVTGGANGIGRGISLELAKQGCSVAIADIQQDAAEKTAKEVSALGVKGIAIKCDVTNADQIKNVVDTVIKEFGKIDILVNNAGGFGPIQLLRDVKEEDWDKALTLNLKSNFLFTQAVVPHMIEKKYGKIINISSLAAISSGPPNHQYAAAKGGVYAMTMGLASELAHHNINVNAIMPGIIQTAMWDHSVPPGVEKGDFLQGMANANVALGRAGTPEDVGMVAVFLASELSRYVTGERITVAGGMPLVTPPPPFG
jgi:3-oxoacyl-[acyl-carrier protein] reductase